MDVPHPSQSRFCPEHARILPCASRGKTPVFILRLMFASTPRENGIVAAR
jgi:hypothetical protein